MTGRHCEHDGCRAYAMRGEIWCRGHHPGLERTGGAPIGNQNAKKHGLYASLFTAEELAELESVAGLEGLTGEIAALRIAVRRLLSDEVSNDKMVVLLARATDAIGRAQRNQRVLAGDRSSGILDALEATLEELEIG